VVVSVTEGPWMVVKHPYIFQDCDLVVINKIDLAQAMQVTPSRIIQDISALNPQVRAILTSCRRQEGIHEVIRALGFPA
jgi:hydrogenase nickel incorporation protein HypB